MRLEAVAPLVRPYPAQLVEIDDGVVLVRGATSLKLRGRGVREAVQAIYEATGSEALSQEDLLSRFPEAFRGAVGRLVEQLVERRFLVLSERPDEAPSPDETAADVFFWNFDTTRSSSGQQLDEANIVVIGRNALGREVLRGLFGSGCRHATWVDDPSLRGDMGSAAPLSEDMRVDELEYEPWATDLEDGDRAWVVGCVEHGGLRALERVNALCVARRLNFLPLGIRRLVGVVGPFVFPGDGPCYACAVARENAAADDPGLEAALDAAAPFAQPLHGTHPAMASLVGSMGALQLAHVLLGLVEPRVGTLTKVNLLTHESRLHRVLRVPRCSICGAGTALPSPSSLRQDLLAAQG